MRKQLFVKFSASAIVGILALACGDTCHAQGATNPAAAGNGASTADAAAAAPVLSDAGILDVLNRVARHQVKPLRDGEYPKVKTMEEARAARPPEGVTWSYPWGVTLYGMQRSVDVTGDKNVEKFVLEHNAIIARDYGWLENLRRNVATNGEWNAFRADRSRVPIGGLMSLGNLDSCGSMGVQFLESVLRHPEQVTEEHKAVAARIADWISVKQQRLPDGTFSRPQLGGTLWIDDLYMGCPYLVRWSKYTGEGKYLDDAGRIIINMASRLQDADGVWFHGYFVNDKATSPIKWGRGDGWAMVSAVETLSAMPDNHPDRAKLLDVLRRQVEGIKKLQAPSGRWHQILNDPTVWEETSCSAMFTYAIARAVNRGWIDSANMAVARRGFDGIAQKVNAEGEVRDTCIGTNIGRDADFYKNRDHPANDHHGPGVVLLAGAEILAGKK